jgi:hypothetical protein
MSTTSLSKSKLWIYQADRFFTPEEEVKVNEILTNFVQNWTAHQHPVAGRFRIEHHLFISLESSEVDTQVSGCSIDSSVKMIKQIGEEFKINFFNRNNIAFIKHDEVMISSFSGFQLLLDTKILNKETKVFNNLVSSSDDLESQRLQELGSSVYKRIFNY